MERFIEQHPTKWQNRYSNEFKHAVITDFLTGNLTRRAVEKKYKIGNSRLTYWLRDKGYFINPPVQSLFLSIMPKSPKLNKTEEEITILKKELEDAILLAESYRQMIDLAEKELKVSIKKKFNTK